jgi:hypothetical protein
MSLQVPGIGGKSLYRRIAVLALALPISFAGVGSALAEPVSQSVPCGTTANKHLCITLTTADHNKTLTVATKTFNAAFPPPTLATWSGTVVCKVNAKTIQTNHYEANVQVHLQLFSNLAPTGSTAKIEIGAVGQASTSLLVTQPVNFIQGETWPVTLSRVSLSAIRSLTVRVRPQFVAGTGTCTVHGGVFNLVD